MTVTTERSVEEFTASPRQLFIDGQWVDAASGRTFETPDPSTGDTLAHIAEGDTEDIERAVRAALRIVGEMADYGREVRRGWGVEGFDVRVGAATGPVIVGEVGAGQRTEYAAFGDTVNIAARLQEAAAPGTVLVDSATQRAVETLFVWGECSLC